MKYSVKYASLTFAFFFLILSQCLVSVSGDNSEDNSTDFAIPYISDSGRLHLFTLHEMQDSDTLFSSMYHIMRTDSGWTTPIRVGEDLFENGNPFNTYNFDNIYYIQSEGQFLTLYFSNPSIYTDMGLYSITYDESNRKWGQLLQHLDLESIHEIIGVTYDKDNYKNYEDDNTIFWRPRAFHPGTDGSIYGIWSFSFRGELNNHKSYVTKSLDEGTILVAVLNEYVQEAAYFYVTDPEVDLIYRGRNTQIRDARFSDGSWTINDHERYSLDLKDFRNRERPSYVYYDDIENILKLKNYVTNTTIEIDIPVDEEMLYEDFSIHFREDTQIVDLTYYSGDTLNLVAVNALQGAILYKADQIFSNRPEIKNPYIITDTSGLSEIYFSDNFQLEKYQYEIFSVNYDPSTHSWSNPKQVTFSEDFTDDYNPVIAFVNFPIFVVTPVLLYLVYQQKRREISNG